MPYTLCIGHFSFIVSLPVIKFCLYFAKSYIFCIFAPVFCKVIIMSNLLIY